jgi:transcriptional regulator with XRE-family HTH domain
MKTLAEWTRESPENERLLAQEYLIATVAQEIWEVMERADVSRATVAERLGKTRSFVTQILSGSKNLTLRTISDIAHALDCEITIKLESACQQDGWVELPVSEQDRVVRFTQQGLSCNQAEWTTLRLETAA